MTTMVWMDIVINILDTSLSWIGAGGATTTMVRMDIVIYILKSAADRWRSDDDDGEDGHSTNQYSRHESVAEWWWKCTFRF